MSLFAQALLLSLLVTGSGSGSPQEPPRVVDVVGTRRQTTCLALVAGELWVGTAGDGLVALTADGPVALGSNRGLPGNRVNDCVMRHLDLWVATDYGLALWEADADAFQTVHEGRFLRVAATAERVVALRADGVVLELAPAEESNSILRQHRFDLAPLSLALADNGAFAVGGADGRLCLAPSGSCLDVGLPLISLAWSAEGLVALAPGQAFRLDQGHLIRSPELDAAALLLPSGQPLQAPELEGLLARDALYHQGRWFVATDEGLLTLADDTPASRSPGPPTAVSAAPNQPHIDLGGCPCGPRLVALARFRSDLWVGGFDNGICRLRKGRWQHFAGPQYLPSDMVNHLAATDRHLYVATTGGLVVVDRKGNFTPHTRGQCEADPKAACPWHESVTGVAVDRANGQVWIADTGALHQWRPQRWRHYYRQRGISSSRITRVAAHGGVVAAGTSDRGLHIGSAGQSFVTMGDSQGLADNWVMDLAFDRSGALWVATCTRGVSRYADGRWQSFTTGEGLADDYTLSVQEIGGRIWIGHFRGITILTERGAVNLSTREGLAGNEVHAVLEHEGRVYLATDGGLTVLEERAKEPVLLSAASVFDSEHAGPTR